MQVVGHLVVYHDDRGEQTYPLYEGANVVGRASSTPERDVERQARWQREYPSHATHGAQLWRAQPRRARRTSRCQHQAHRCEHLSLAQPLPGACQLISLPCSLSCATAGLLLDSNRISAQHAIIQAHKDTGLSITDLGSRNKVPQAPALGLSSSQRTALTGQPVQTFRIKNARLIALQANDPLPTLLRSGETIKFGALECRVYLAGASSQASLLCSTGCVVQLLQAQISLSHLASCWSHSSCGAQPEDRVQRSRQLLAASCVS